MAPEFLTDENGREHLEDLLNKRGTPIEGQIRAYKISTPDGEEVVVVSGGRGHPNKIIGNQLTIDRIHKHLDGVEIFGTTEIPESGYVGNRENDEIREAKPPYTGKVSQEILDKPIWSLDLPIRTANSLTRAGYKDVRELIEIAEGEDALHNFLTRFRNFGEKSTRHVIQKLMDIEGISFDESLEPMVKEISKERDRKSKS